MLDLTPNRSDLDPIEIASRDEIAALQLRAAAVDAAPRLRQRAALPEEVRRGGRPPGRPQVAWRTSRSSRSPPRRTCATTIRSACSRCRASRSPASTPPPAPPASRPWSATPRATSTPGPTSMARSIRASGGRPGMTRARRLRLRPVHRRARRALRRGAARLHRHPDLRRHDRAAGAADRRLRARHHHGDAELHAGDPRRVPQARASIRARRRSRSASSAPSRGPTRCARRSRTPSTCTPSTSTACPR